MHQAHQLRLAAVVSCPAMKAVMHSSRTADKGQAAASCRCSSSRRLSRSCGQTSSGKARRASTWRSISAVSVARTCRLRRFHGSQSGLLTGQNISALAATSASCTALSTARASRPISLENIMRMMTSIANEVRVLSIGIASPGCQPAIAASAAAAIVITKALTDFGANAGCSAWRFAAQALPSATRTLSPCR